MAVSHVAGVVNVDGDSDERTIEVGYDPQVVSVAAIREALDDIGYESTEMTSTPPS